MLMGVEERADRKRGVTARHRDPERRRVSAPAISERRDRERAAQWVAISRNYCQPQPRRIELETVEPELICSVGGAHSESPAGAAASSSRPRDPRIGPK
jgi:hypothetical protein